MKSLVVWGTVFRDSRWGLNNNYRNINRQDAKERQERQVEE